MPKPAPSDLSPLKRLALLPEPEQAAFLVRHAKAAGLTVDAFLKEIITSWEWVGRPKQKPPESDWTFFVANCGRGFGKTRAGAEWAKKKALAHPGCRIALVAPTLMDTRDVQVEGESGLLSILPDYLLRGGQRSTAWNRGPVELYLENGSTFHGYSSVEPDRLRGPQHHYLWGEEFSSWKDAHKGDALETTWSNAKLGCRLGRNPQFFLGSTPKPNKLTTTLLAIPAPRAVVVIGSSYENRDNLSPLWWQEVIAPYEGSRLGDQEIHAIVLEDVEGALWTKALLESLRVEKAPDLARIIVGVDPNASSSEAANSAGIVVAGCDSRSGIDRKGYVLDDRTVTRGGPRAWAQAAVDAYHDHNADLIVAEKNQGGEMVELTIRTVDPNVPIKLVSASRGKRTRAEPIASLYEGSDTIPGRVHHVGYLPQLEAEQTTWTPESESPDRMDALVWALTELMLGETPRLRSSVPKGRIPLPNR